MKRLIRNSTILIFPFLLMIIINEFIRPTIHEKSYSKYGITTVNSDDSNSNKCTWICQNETRFCKAHHVKYLKPYYKYSDILYFGMIGIFKETGNYGMANIVFLVVLGPFLMWFFIIKSLNTQDEINKLKNSRG